MCVKNNLLIGILSGLLSVCASAAPPNLAISGLDKLDEQQYIAVVDSKSQQQGTRLWRLSVYPELSYQALTWPQQTSRSNDLESVCVLSHDDKTQHSELLALESSQYKNQWRLFHLGLYANTLDLIKIYPIPATAKPTNFEGLACVKKATKVQLIMGERSGFLYQAQLNLQQQTFRWQPAITTMPINLPKSWQALKHRRAISGLHLQDGKLWASASIDKGNHGWFRSIIYPVATWQNQTLMLVEQPEITWQIDGLKIEGIAAGTKLVDGCVLSMASEDENYGGVWRCLGQP